MARKKEGTLDRAALPALLTWAEQAPQDDQKIVSLAVNEILDAGVNVGPAIVEALIKVVERKASVDQKEGPSGTQA